MLVKHEWRKREKALYLPKTFPEWVDVPEFGFITIRGEGSPAEDVFADKVGALYALAYTIKMTLKKMRTRPAGYFDFTFYPLEGVWDINEEAKASFSGKVNKADFVYRLMIRQPDFVDEALFMEMLDLAKQKKNQPHLDQLSFERFSEGACVQMLHLGRFEDEPASFERMELFASENGLFRLSKVHREIYLSDTRKVAPEKLRTVLRFKVSSQQNESQS